MAEVVSGQSALATVQERRWPFTKREVLRAAVWLTAAEVFMSAFQNPHELNPVTAFVERVSQGDSCLYKSIYDPTHGATIEPASGPDGAAILRVVPRSGNTNQVLVLQAQDGEYTAVPPEPASIVNFTAYELARLSCSTELLVEPAQ